METNMHVKWALDVHNAQLLPDWTTQNSSMKQLGVLEL